VRVRLGAGSEIDVGMFDQDEPTIRAASTDDTYGFELMSQDGQEFSWVTIDGKEVVSAAALVYDGWSIYSLLLDFGGSQLTISDSRHAASRLLASTVPRPPRTPL
jgi:hypothetical protein